MRFFICIVLLFTQALMAQARYVLPNEVAVFSFETAKGKKAMLVKDKENKYIVYRFGTKDKIELEYPDKDSKSWDKFMFTHYHRGGGKANAGVEIDNIVFENKDFQYVIYRNYSAGDDENPEETTVGVAVMKPGLGTLIKDIKGDANTIKGSWYELKEDGLLKDGTEKYGLY